MISKVEYLGNLRTKATHLKSGNIILTDAPIDNNGKGEAFSPTDLVATSLASCAMTIMGIVADRHDLDINDAYAEVDKLMSSNPRRIGEIIIKIYLNGTRLNNESRGKLERAARLCPVSGSLNTEIVENINFIYAE